MLPELSQKEFEKIRPLLAGQLVNMEIKGVAAGNNPGWIFVDDRGSPQTALVFAHGQKGFYFLGREENPLFNGEIHSTIEGLRPRLAQLGIDEFEYSGTSPAWESSLWRLFAGRSFQQFRQHVYAFSKLQESRLPEWTQSGYQAVELTKDLLGDLQLNRSFAQRILLEWWETLERFTEVGAGYGVICDGQIVSLCYTSFVGEPGEWELGVDTHPDFRRRGFAKLAALAMLEKCRERGVCPYWDCTETNVPSCRLAQGLGFTLAFTYQAYWFPLA